MFELNDLQSLSNGLIKYQRSLKLFRVRLFLAVRDIVRFWMVDGLEIKSCHWLRPEEALARALPNHLRTYLQRAS